MKKQTIRQRQALNRLTVQLQSGVKTGEDGGKYPLTEKDIKRINREIEILKSRL